MRIFRWLVLAAVPVALLAAVGQGNQPPKAEKPDLIVADFRLEDDNFVLEVQNQGPGTFKKGTTIAVVSGSRRVQGKTVPVSLTVAVPLPVDVKAIETVKIPVEQLDVTDFTELSNMFKVELDAKMKLNEERKHNTYYRQLDFTGRQIQPARGDYKTGTDLPDLVITDITRDKTYYYVHYTNKGKGATGADFLVSVRSGNKKFDGNFYYRFRVPAPGEECKTGGLTPGRIGLTVTDECEVEAVIDHEDRVRETDKTNNTFKKKFTK